jgi:hypothetical protein
VRACVGVLMVVVRAVVARRRERASVAGVVHSCMLGRVGVAVRVTAVHVCLGVCVRSGRGEGVDEVIPAGFRRRRYHGLRASFGVCGKVSGTAKTRR